VQADLKTFSALGVHGTTAITCVTAQNPRQVLAIEPCPPKILRQQIEAVFAELPPVAVKIGILFSAGNVRAVADFFCQLPARSRVPLVIDPVLVSTSGRRLLAPAARKILTAELLPLATLITPNLDEAGILLGARVRSVDQMRQAARELHRRYGCAVLVKGGHLPRGAAVDFFCDGTTEMDLSAARLPGIRTHGTGCTYSAAICAALALGNDLPAAVRIGKRFVTSAIANRYRIGAHDALDQNAPTPGRRSRAGSGR
jgi:hydroxymethylpyrimidine/phosphomethylpyrimidine kinase